MSEILYTWKFSSKKNRSGIWYIIALSGVLGIVIWGFITRQYGLSLILLLVAGILFYVENNSEDEVVVNITGSGIQLAQSFYDFSSIREYIFIMNGSEISLIRLFINKGNGYRSLDIDINSEIAQEVKNILPNFISEGKNQEMSFIEKIIRLFNL